MPSFNPISLVSLIPAALALAGSASAASIASSAPAKEYYIKTSALEHNSFDNLYVYGVDTDAGVKTVHLSYFKSSGVKAYMDDGQQWFNYGTQFPYGMNMNEGTMEAGKFLASSRRYRSGSIPYRWHQ
jgi:hypothetical protein